MHGLGNDFLIFPWSEELPQKNIIKALSSRTKGIGCDLIVFLIKLEKISQIIKLTFSIMMELEQKFVVMHWDV